MCVRTHWEVLETSEGLRSEATHSRSCCPNALQVPGFATFEAMVRIFRVVRVFRVFRLGKRLKDEVLSCVLTVTFTLLAVIVTGAGVFYEIETNFSVRMRGWILHAGPPWCRLLTLQTYLACGPAARGAGGCVQLFLIVLCCCHCRTGTQT